MSHCTVHCDLLADDFISTHLERTHHWQVIVQVVGNLALLYGKRNYRQTAVIPFTHGNSCNYRGMLKIVFLQRTS